MSRLRSSAVCRAAIAPLRAEPRDDAEQVTQALRGEPLAVEEQRDGWARVRTAYDYPGWIREEALDERAAGAWLGEQQDRDPLEEARSFLGSPYEWGGMTGRGIDCSGLVHMAYRRVGRLVPRDADQQEVAGQELPVEALTPGDLVTYGRGKRADHIAFWVGDGRILHSRAGAGVVEELESDDLRVRRRRLIRL